MSLLSITYVSAARQRFSNDEIEKLLAFSRVKNAARDVSGLLLYWDGNFLQYVEGPPELIVEVSATSASIDLHQKKNAYRRNGVREYLVWRTLDRKVDWFRLDGGEYVALEPDAAGVLESREFSGLRLDVPALLAGDLARVLGGLRETR